jgi:putative CocE/NonD family hydrolase
MKADFRYLFVVFSAAFLLFFSSCSNLKWTLISRFAGVPRSTSGVRIEEDVQIPMRDGVRLAADIYFPTTSGYYPVILLFASHGYAVVVQDTRGRHGSEGRFRPLLDDSSDGADTIRWISSQTWSDGKVGMFGVSYNASTQWLAAPYETEHLLAIVPIFAPQDTYRVWLNGGAFHHNLNLFWHYQNRLPEFRDFHDSNWEQALWTLPLSEADDVIEQDNPVYNSWIDHPVPDAFWKQMSVHDRVKEMETPALLVAGWFDPFLEPMLEDYNRMRTEGIGNARESQIVIGPWTHRGVSDFQDVKFGGKADFMKLIPTYFRWYNYWLKDEDNGIAAEGPIRLFVMGRNQWRTETEWPLARTEYRKFYLHSHGQADCHDGDGSLHVSMPDEEGYDRYVYDPEHPVPTVGGTDIYGNQSGPADQRELGERDDVLVYMSEPLSDEMEVTGPVRIVLYASSTAPDTDFAAKLVDKQPNGKVLYITSGLVRARFRDSLQRPTFLVEDYVYRFEISLSATSYVFGKGHSIGLYVSSSDFPKYDRNLNTREPIGTGAVVKKATQTIFHGPAYPSHLILPVIPLE